MQAKGKGMGKQRQKFYLRTGGLESLRGCFRRPDASPATKLPQELQLLVSYPEPKSEVKALK